MNITTKPELEFVKHINESTVGENRLSLAVHARVTGTSLYSIAKRSVRDVPVRLLSKIEDSDWSDPILQELRGEAIADLNHQFHSICMILGQS